MTEREALEVEQLRTLINQSIAETAKIQSQTAKIQTENRYYPFIVGSSATLATLAIVAIVKLFL